MKTLKFFKATSVLLFVVTFFSSAAHGKLLQILHTNDTHSYLDNSTHETLRGGSARLKSLIDTYKKQMGDLGVKTLVLDGGDFLEGNLYYMSKNGRKSFEVHNEIGYDAGVLGNHDYLMGTPELDKLLGEIDLKFSLVVANITVENKFKNASEKIKPYQEFDIDGLKIAILGLTTDEIVYRWRLEGGKILDPFKTAKKYEKILKERNNDFIFALTHIGVLNDIKLAEKTKSIDLIVGGHSHTALYQPSYGINEKKIRVPIVQAGMHTEYLGRLVVDVEKGRPLKVVSYELVPVTGEGKVDSKVKEMVKEADDELNVIYGQDWLNEKIGYSDLQAGDEKGATKWAYFITDAMKEKTRSDIGIHVSSMNGENFPVGEITRRTIFNSMPRIFDVYEKFGWNIYTAKMRGAFLRVMLVALSYFDTPLTFSGIKFEYTRGPLGLKINRVTINGKPINPYKNYTVAFTEGIIRGAEEINPRTLAILKRPQDTKFKIWSTLEEKILEGMQNKNGKSLIMDYIKEGPTKEHTVLLPK